MPAAKGAKARPPKRRISSLGLVVVGVGLAGVLALVLPRLLAQTGSGGPVLAVLETADFHALAFSPDNPNVVFFGHHNGVMRSDDGGRTWRSVVARPNFDAMALAVDRTNPRRVYLAGHNIFMVSSDGGATWEPVRHNLPDDDIHGFTLGAQDPNRVYAFVVGHGLFFSPDGGATWARLSTALPQDVMVLAAAGGEPEVLLAGSMGSGVLKSTDGGRTWQPSNDGLGSRRVMALAVNPADRQRVYAGTDDGLYRSDDGGETWRRLPFPGRNAAVVAVSPADPNLVLALEAAGPRQGRLYRSADGGLSWGGRP